MFLKNKDKVANEFPVGLKWLNTDGLSIRWLRGKLVFIGFFSFSSYDGLMMIRFLKYIFFKYSKFGLVVVGVNSPEFDFDGDFSVVEAALDELGVVFPVVVDLDHEIFDKYGGRFGAKCVLVDGESFIVGDWGFALDFSEIESRISEELRVNGVVRLPDLEDFGYSGDSCKLLTPDVHLGCRLGRYSNTVGVERGHVRRYFKRRTVDDTPTLIGDWVVYSEYLESRGGRVVVPFSAEEVCFVADGEGVVEVRCDGEVVVHFEAGDDVEYIDDIGIVKVSGGRMYKALQLDGIQERELELVADKGIVLYRIYFR